MLVLMIVADIVLAAADDGDSDVASRISYVNSQPNKLPRGYL